MPAFIFDLDGTLVDTVYAHIFAWQRAFAEAGLEIDGWRIHRRIGMSGGLLTKALARELGQDIEPDQAELLKRRHAELYGKFLPERRPVRGARELLDHLRSLKIPFGIATSGKRPDIDPSLAALDIGKETVVVEQDDVRHTKPEPDLLLACQEKLGVKPQECYVVGDAVWDLLAARHANMLSLGLLSGGSGAEELFHAGAFRIYADLADLHSALYELGVSA